MHCTPNYRSQPIQSRPTPRSLPAIPSARSGARRCRSNRPPPSPACPAPRTRRSLPCRDLRTPALALRIAFDTRYAAPPTAIRYAALCFLIASIATGPRSALPIIANETGLRQHHLGELVHARGGGRACGADGFVAHRIDRADVIDHAIGEVDRQRLRPWRACRRCACAQRRGPSASCPTAAASRPASSGATSSRVSVFRFTRARFRSGSHCTFGHPSSDGGFELRDARAVQREVRVTRRRAVRE